LGKSSMLKIVHVVGWILWCLGLIYGAVGLATGDRVVALLRDSTLQKHQLWDDGPLRKAQAKIAIFEVSDRFTAFNHRIYWTLTSLMAAGTVMILIGRKRPNKAPEPTPTAVTPRAMERKTK
jgi:hypothetical protein